MAKSVISGINGCGKSTISKLLYYTFKNTLQFDNLVLDIINKMIMPYIDVLAQMQMQMSPGLSSRRHIKKHPLKYLKIRWRGMLMNMKSL